MTLLDGNMPRIGEAGATYASASVNIPASQLSSGLNLPKVKVSGTFWNIDENGRGGHSLTYWGGGISEPYSHTFIPPTPTKNLNKQIETNGKAISNK